MVSKAREDFPDPLRPVMTVRVLRGISTSIFFKLCWRAPRTEILVIAIRTRSCIDLAPQRAKSAPMGVSDFRNVDGSPEMLESESAQCYSRILLVNRNGRQLRIK